METLQSILTSIQKLQKRDLQLLKAFSRATLFSNIVPRTENTLKMIESAEKLAQQIKKMDKISVQEALDTISAVPNNFNISKLPKIDLSNYNERLERITRHNANLGWTLTKEMPLKLYLSDKYLTMKPDELDQIFVSFYEDNNYQQFKILMNVLKNGLSEKWKDLFDQTLELYLKGKFKITIPALISVIEGELSIILRSEKYGRRLLNEFEDKLDDNIRFLTISSFSAYYFFDEHLFKTHDFTDVRLPLLNRNWILHGRDDPSDWKREDALKLLNALSTLQFIKESEIS
ncbi:hypothetical protein [Bacillus safensis]|uniref:hypothetical protein n=1 Tax=Bacillus safensis TaxID=561879 RepID=UPI0022B7D39F|nr:hypothetical protein [Bacillus safensis]